MSANSDLTTYLQKVVPNYENLNAPFHPSQNYPEYKMGEISVLENQVYDKTRQLLIDMGLDEENTGKDSWNPLGDFVNKGGRIVIKPNLVSHKRKNVELATLITHGSLIRVMMDYAIIALGGEGTIVLGDAPIQGADMDEIYNNSGISEILLMYKEKNIASKIQFVDFRIEKVLKFTVSSIPIRQQLEGDPYGYTVFNLKNHSEFEDLKAEEMENFRVYQYNPDDMNVAHAPGKHIYHIANSVIQSDLVISLPKLKTHKYAGLTNAAKLFVGMVGRKDTLPHYRRGSLQEGGDSYEKSSLRVQLIEKLYDIMNRNRNFFLRNTSFALVKIIEITKYIKPLSNYHISGRWKRNDTVSRMIVDLNKILKYGDTEGNLKLKPQRTVLSITDAIIAGQGNGPLDPTPIEFGLLIGGLNLINIDIISAILFDIKPMNLSYLKHALNLNIYKLTTIKDITELSISLEGIKYSIKDIPKDLIKKVDLADGWEDLR